MKRIKHRCIAYGLIFIILSLCACCPLCDRPNHRWVPYEGVWYCDDLQAQLAFDNESETYIMVNGEKVLCEWCNEYGSVWLEIICIEEDHPNFQHYQCFFAGEMTHLDDNGGEYTLRDENGVEYVFVRID